MTKSRKMVFGRYDFAGFGSFFAYASGSVAIPVMLVSLSRELGFSLEQGGMTAGGALQLGRTVPMVVSMLLCGFIAGRWGKRRTFGYSVLLMGIGVGLCAFAPVYSVLFMALVIAGAGEGVIEGLATPFIRDLHPDQPGRYINFTHGFWSVGILFTVLVAGGLLSLGVSWRLITAAVSLTAIVPAFILLIPFKKGQHYPDHPESIHWKVIHDQIVTIIKIPRFWVFFGAMFLAGGSEFCLTFWSASYIQLNFTPAAWAGGVGTAFFAGGMVLGRTGWGFLIDQHHLKHLIVYSALAGVLITLFFPTLSSLWLFFGLLFLAGITTAPLWPSIQSYCVDAIPEADPTMIFILLSCAGVPGCGVFTFLMGFIGNKWGLSPSFYIVPICFLVLAVMIATQRRIGKKKD